MSKPENKTEETKTESKRELPVIVIPMYKDDAEALGFKENLTDGKVRSQIRSKVRETLGLPVRVRQSGVNAELKTKLGLKADATTGELNKAMKEKLLSL